jgi:NADPH2:quinone reductase
MRAVTIVNSSVVIAEHPAPTAGPGELLVRVRAAGINGADAMQVLGLYPPPPGVPADIPGLELAGEVIATGGGAERYRPGDRVMALVQGGGQAELAVVDERVTLPVPPTLDWPAAGGFPEVFVTAHDALVTQCVLRPGERLLVHGAAGGVGTAAVQLGVALGARVTGTVRNERLRAAVAELGAEVIDPTATLSSGPFDVILELVGAVNFPRNLEVLAVGGRISVIGIGAGAQAEIDLRQLMARRARLLGSTLRPRSVEERGLAVSRVEADVIPLVAAGRIRVPVAATYALAAATDAYTRFQSGGKLGKVVLTVG